MNSTRLPWDPRRIGRSRVPNFFQLSDLWAEEALIYFNAGVLLEGENIRDTADALYDRIMQTVNGESQTRNEINQYAEIGIFKHGITI
jgi:altronate dehydratase